MITEDYVSFETAKLLKEKGLKGLCTAYYDCFTTDNFHCGNEPTDFNSIDTKIRNIVAAPTSKMVMKWLREVHKIFLNVSYIPEHFAFTYRVISPSGETKLVTYVDTYEKACEAAIKYCLENLI